MTGRPCARARIVPANVAEVIAPPASAMKPRRRRRSAASAKAWRIGRKVVSPPPDNTLAAWLAEPDDNDLRCSDASQFRHVRPPIEAAFRSKVPASRQMTSPGARARMVLPPRVLEEAGASP